MKFCLLSAVQGSCKVRDRWSENFMISKAPNWIAIRSSLFVRTRWSVLAKTLPKWSFINVCVPRLITRCLWSCLWWGDDKWQRRGNMYRRGCEGNARGVNSCWEGNSQFYQVQMLKTRQNLSQRTSSYSYRRILVVLAFTFWLQTYSTTAASSHPPQMLDSV